MNSDLLSNLDKIHTTELGLERIRKNLNLDVEDVVQWCKKKIQAADHILRKGKNWYVDGDDAIITIHATSFTIITAHQNKSKEKGASY